MTSLRHIACGITSVLFLQNCSEILEPVSLFSGKPDVEIEGVQEDFKINIKNLTFESARDSLTMLYTQGGSCRLGSDLARMCSTKLNL